MFQSVRPSRGCIWAASLRQAERGRDGGRDVEKEGGREESKEWQLQQLGAISCQESHHNHGNQRTEHGCSFGTSLTNHCNTFHCVFFFCLSKTAVCCRICTKCMSFNEWFDSRRVPHPGEFCGEVRLGKHAATSPAPP